MSTYVPKPLTDILIKASKSLLGGLALCFSFCSNAVHQYITSVFDSASTLKYKQMYQRDKTYESYQTLLSNLCKFYAENENIIINLSFWHITAREMLFLIMFKLLTTSNLQSVTKCVLLHKICIIQSCDIFYIFYDFLPKSIKYIFLAMY